MKIALLQLTPRNMPCQNSTYMRLLEDYLRQQGHRVMPIFFRSYPVSFPLFEKSWMTAIERLRRFGPDIILEECRSYPLFSRMNSAVKRMMSVPVAAIVESLSQGQSDGQAWSKAPRRRHESEFYESVDALVFTNRTSYNAAMRKHTQVGHAIVAYPAGNHFAGIESSEKIVERARRCGPLQLLFRGDVLPGSGLIRLIHCLATIPEGSWQLRVIGDFQLDRSYTKRINRLVQRAGLDGWIDLTGPLEGDALEEYYIDSHAVFVPFSSDRYEMAVIEAMGYGLPAFCPATGASGELVQNGVNGFLVSPHNLADSAVEVAQLYHDRDRLMVMGLAAWSASRQHPGWIDCFEAIEALLFRVKAGCSTQPSSRSSTSRRNMIMIEN